MVDFASDKRSSDSLRGSRNFYGHANNARFHRFPVGQILRHSNRTTSIGESVKTFGTQFLNFYHKESFFQKRKRCSQNFYSLRLQAVISPQWLQIAGNSLPSGFSTGCLVFIFTVIINLDSFHRTVRPIQEMYLTFYSNFRQRQMSDIAY